MVVSHSPAVAFAAANVGFPKICVSWLFRNHNVYVLHARLAALRRICLILCQYRSRRSLCLLLSKNHRKFRHDPTIALWSYGNSPSVYPLLL
jgi:hypothetical protein